MNDGIRVNKFLSQCGFCSRRKAEELIKEKRILINDNIALIGQKIYKDDIVRVDNVIVTNKNIEFKYYLLNKPKKTICSLKDNFNRNIVTDLIDDDDYLFPVGRLDYNTTGVLLITNDGELANKLIHPSSQITRTYRATLNEPLTKKELIFLNGKDVIVNNKISFQKVEQIEKKSYLISLTQGTYHHIKELFKLVNKNVVNLKRISFANLTCEKLMVGQYRKLTLHEVKKIKQLVNNIKE